MGLMPGIMGTSIPSLLQRSTKEKVFSLSKNICVTIYSAPAFYFFFKPEEV